MICAYYYPGWHPDPARNPDAAWSEWEVVYAARPRFDGHRQPRLPRDGRYRDDDPATVARHVDQAWTYGIDGFIACFYWDRGRRILEAPLRHLRDLKGSYQFRFAVMWVNRKPYATLPLDPAGPHYNTNGGKTVHIISDGRKIVTDPEDFLSLVRYLIAQYFGNGRYLTCAGRPLLQIYSVEDWLADLGNTAPEVLATAHRLCREAGFEGLHLVGVVHRHHAWLARSRQVGLAGLTSYVLLPDWEGPTIQAYPDLAAARQRNWTTIRTLSAVPYSPSVCVGWDSSPRGVWRPVSDRDTFPWAPIVVEDKPKHFAAHLAAAVQFGAEDGVFRLASWNEWSEGHALEPEADRGDALLAAVHRVKEAHGG